MANEPELLVDLRENACYASYNRTMPGLLIQNLIDYVDTLKGSNEWMKGEIEQATRMIHDLQLENPAYMRGRGDSWEELLDIVHRLFGHGYVDRILTEQQRLREGKTHG